MAAARDSGLWHFAPVHPMRAGPVCHFFIALKAPKIANFAMTDHTPYIILLPQFLKGGNGFIDANGQRTAQFFQVDIKIA